MVRLTGGLVRGPNRGVAFKELMGLGGGEKEKDTLWNYLEGVFSKSGTQSRHDYSPYLASEQMLFGEDLGYLLTPGMDQHPTPPHTPCPSGQDTSGSWCALLWAPSQSVQQLLGFKKIPYGFFPFQIPGGQ